jgi:hypothetical protein
MMIRKTVLTSRHFKTGDGMTGRMLMRRELATR